MNSLLLIVRFCHARLERYAQTTHSFNKPSGSSVVITNPIHPLHGHTVVVRQIRKVGKLTKVIVTHPGGGLLSLPSDETSLENSEVCSTTEQTTRLFDPEKLLRLSEWVQERSMSKEVKKLPGHQLDQLVKYNKTDDTTAQKSKSFANRKRRTHKALSGANGTASGQNALHWGDKQHPEQEQN